MTCKYTRPLARILVLIMLTCAFAVSGAYTVLADVPDWQEVTVPNGSFDTNISGWSALYGAATSANIVWDSSVNRTPGGGGSLRFIANPADDKTVARHDLGGLFEAGERYRISAWVAFDGISTNSRLQIRESWDNNVDYWRDDLGNPGAGEWVQIFTQEFYATGTEDTIGFSVYGDADVWFDDIRVEVWGLPVTTPPVCDTCNEDPCVCPSEPPRPMRPVDLPNAGFETGIWAGVGGGTTEHSTEQARNGNFSMRIPGGTDTWQTFMRIAFPDLIAGEQMQISGWVFVTPEATSGTARLVAAFHPGNDRISIAEVDLTSVPRNEWVEITGLISGSGSIPNLPELVLAFENHTNGTIFLDDLTLMVTYTEEPTGPRPPAPGYGGNSPVRQTGGGGGGAPPPREEPAEESAEPPREEPPIVTPEPPALPFTLTMPAVTNFDFAGFYDVYGHWARRYIDELARRDIVSGFPGGNFSPNGHITRAEFAALVASALRLEAGSGGVNFSDVPANSWHNGYIQAVVSAGLMRGVGDNNFAPEDNITRQDVAVVINNILQIAHPNYREGEIMAIATFNDEENIADYARIPVITVEKYGIMLGRPGDLFDPRQRLQRAEAAVIIHRLFNIQM